MRDIALREGVAVPKSVEESCRNLIETGRLVAPSRFQMEKRSKLKLPKIPLIEIKSVKKMATKTRVARFLKVK